MKLITNQALIWSIIYWLMINFTNRLNYISAYIHDEWLSLIIDLPILLAKEDFNRLLPNTAQSIVTTILLQVGASPCLN